MWRKKRALIGLNAAGGQTATEKIQGSEAGAQPGDTTNQTKPNQKHSKAKQSKAKQSEPKPNQTKTKQGNKTLMLAASLITAKLTVERHVARVRLVS